MNPIVMEDAVLIDTNIVLFALGATDPRKEPCQRYLAELATGRGRGYASTEMIQEVVHHRLRKTGSPATAVADGKLLMSALTILNINYEVLATSLQLIEEVPGIRGRDAIHAATALEYGIPTIASNDTKLVLPSGLTRVDPTADASTTGSPKETP